MAQASSVAVTVAHPAAVTAAAPAAEEGLAQQSLRVIVSVTGFRPPREGAVQAIVKAEGEGEPEREIGRFGIFPNTEFKAADPANARRYGIPLPKDLAGKRSLELHVYLAPLRGDGSGAVLEIAGAEIR